MVSFSLLLRLTNTSLKPGIMGPLIMNLDMIIFSVWVCSAVVGFTMLATLAWLVGLMTGQLSSALYTLSTESWDQISALVSKGRDRLQGK